MGNHGLGSFHLVGPPCTTFSLARTPKLRNLRKPWGFSLMDWFTLVGNVHAGQCLMLAILQIMVGNFFGGEQPAWGFMRALGPWVWLACQPGVQQVVFDWCRYHREFKKTTRLLTNFPGMDQLGKRCHHAQRHVPLKGQATTRAGAYSRAFCEKVATLCWNG